MGSNEANRIAREEQLQEINTVYAPLETGDAESEKQLIASRIAATQSYKAEQQAKRDRERAEIEAQGKEIEKLKAEYARRKAAGSGPIDYYENVISSYNEKKARYAKPDSPSSDRTVRYMQERLEAINQGVDFEKEKARRIEGMTPHYSDPTKAIGYNPATGRVEVGRGDDRGVVVSVSKTEDRLTNIAIGKEAGYSGTPTVDPRYAGMFKPVEGGLYDTKTRAYEKAASPKPQTPKKQVLTNQPPSMDYSAITGQSANQALDNQKHTAYSLSLVETAPKYTITLNGREIPNLSAREVEEYKKTFALGNAVQKMKIKKQSAKNTSELKEFVETAKAQGYKTISVNTTAGPKDIPINRAMYDLRKGMVDGAVITGIGLAPIIPKGFTLAGNLASPILLSDKDLEAARKIQKEKDRPKDMLEDTLAFFSRYKPKNLIEELSTGAILEFTGGIAQAVNLGKLAAEKVPLYFTGKAPPAVYERIPTLTASSEFTGGLTGAAIETYRSGNLKKWPGAAAQVWANATKLAQEQGLGKTAGGLLGFVYPGGPSKIISKIIPIKAGTLPLYLEGEKVVGAVSEVALGYGSKLFPVAGKLAKEYGGSFYLGGYNPARIAVEKISAPLERFNRFEPTAYSAYQQRLFRKAITYAEQIGVTKPGFVETQKQIESELARQSGVNFIQKKTIPEQLLEQVPAKEPTYKLAAALGKLERLKVIEPIKGSLIAILGKDRLARPAKDIDADVIQSLGLLGKSGKLEKQIEILKEKAAKEPSIKKREKIFGKITKIENQRKIIEDLLNVPLEFAHRTLIKTPAGEGFAYATQGKNIVRGEIDIEQPLFDIEIPKGFAAHGTTLKSAKGIMEEGADPFKRPFGEPAFFATLNKEILENFAAKGGTKPRVVLGKLETQNILQYKKIPKRERLQILKERDILSKKTGKPKWLAYQEVLSEYAKKRGFTGVTKPYHSTNPLAEKYEVIIFEKGVFKPSEIIKPTGYGIKPETAEEVVNFITSKEQIKNPLEAHLPDKGKIFGKKYQKKKIKYKIPGEKEKFASKTPFYQIQTKTAEITGIETAESLSKAQNLKPEQIEKMMQGGKFVMSTEGHRTKSIMDFYMQTRDAAKIQFLAGNRAGALESAKTMVAVQKYFSPLIEDFGAAIREYRPTLEIIERETKTAGQKIRGALSAIRADIPVKAAVPLGLKIPDTREKEQPSPLNTSLRKSEKELIGSSKLASAKMFSSRATSPLISRGASVKLTSASPYSSMSSQKNIKETSAKSISAKPSYSASSPFSKGVSAKSISAKPSPSVSPLVSPTVSPSVSPTVSPLVSPLISPTLSPSVKPFSIKPLDIITKSISVRSFSGKKKAFFEKPSPIGEKVDFIGNVPVSEISGLFGKRSDIVYGSRKSAKLAGIDVKKSSKGLFISRRTGGKKTRGLFSSSKNTKVRF